MIIGVDEVGRGPWAGPVVAAAVVIPSRIDGLADSKKLSRKRRRELAATIWTKGIASVAAASVSEVDKLNVLQASLLAMKRAILGLAVEADEVLVDGNRVPELPMRTRAIIGGDNLVPEISAASIVAKVIRDDLMQRLSQVYPGYGWERNAGYGTKQHQDAISQLGITPHHRQSFKPIRLFLETAGT